MPVVGPEKLITLQRASDGIRNICVLAHVDHGKTSLTDALIATNGIISPKLAGKIRYLDSRPDEQLRGITMESSAISLSFSMLRRPAPDQEPEPREYLINLIDSPGHIDFSSEVSTASRLCDGAVVLVDAVEGVCSQTVTVLRQTWLEKLKPLLVINKMDRLIVELKLSPAEAYTHLSKLLEQVNAVMGSFALGERMEDDLRWRERIDEKVNAARGTAAAAADRKGGQTNGTAPDDDTDVALDATSMEYEERDDEGIYFEPGKNNVIFSSATDGWAFTPRQFAALYEKKLGIKRRVLEKVLWGDFYLDPKTKRVLGPKHLKGRKLRPMFVQLVLENIWAVYEATTGGPTAQGDGSLLDKITKSLNVTIPPYVMRSRDPKALLSAVFAAWLPLSTAVLVSVLEHLPSPCEAQASRMPTLLDQSPGSAQIDARVRTAMMCSTQEIGQPVVAYVSKMVSIPESELPSHKPRGGGIQSGEEARELARKKRAEIARLQASAHRDASVNALSGALSSAAISDVSEKPAASPPDDPEHLIGFARLFSGTLTVGDEIYVLPPKYTPARPHAAPRPRRVTITALYLLMGRSLERLESVPAGNVVGIAGLAGALLKCGTLCSQRAGAPNLASTTAIASHAPIVRVALEPAHPRDLHKMVRGLRLLEQADPAATYEQLASGEHVIVTAGELHLERCLKDVRERFAKCDVQAGEPMVPFREGIVAADDMAPPRDAGLGRGRVESVTPSALVTIRLHVRPLPSAVTDFLVRNAASIKRLYAERKAQERGSAQRSERPDGREDDDANDDDTDADSDATDDEADLLGAAPITTPDPTPGAAAPLSADAFHAQLVAAFAEATRDANAAAWRSNVVDRIVAFGPRHIGPNVFIDATDDGQCAKFFHSGAGAPAPSALLADKVAHAFQLATAQGPLCHEPTHGVAVTLEALHVATGTAGTADTPPADAARLTGEVLAAGRAAVHAGMRDWSARLLRAMYLCEVAAAAGVVGRVAGVVARRRGRVLAERVLAGGAAGTDTFTVSAALPVAESFGFADEVRQRTHGFAGAAPQMRFAGFEMLAEDPFWVPRTADEREEWGDAGERVNVALRYVEGVRARKGLAVRRKVVERAERQKTLKR